MNLKLGIDFTNGVTLFTYDWDTMVRYVNGGDVLMVIVCDTGEILFDRRDGWDIVTDQSRRTRRTFADDCVLIF